MSLCVVGITVLQLYYSSVNYDIARTKLDKEVNEAFAEAIDSSFSLHRQYVVKEVGRWMRDNSRIQAAGKWDEKKHRMVFKLKEVFEGSVQKDREISFTVETMENKKLSPREAKEFMIKQMQKEVMYSLKNGIVLFYTQELGRMTDDLYRNTPLERKVINNQYSAALRRRNIELPFTIVENETGEGELCTQQYGVATEYVRENRKVTACFDSIDSYLLGQLKWIIIGTFILIFITLICFWYTIRTLLTQQKLSEMKDDFISNMTHEIHSPISSVLVTAESLKRFEHDEQSRKNYLDIIIYQAKRLASLADEILAGARLDKKGIALTDTIDVEGLLSEIASEYKDKAVIETDFQHGVLLKSNESHLNRAVVNLVENAIKYNEREDIRLWVSSEVKNNELIISVADNGPGIPAEYKQKIFSQFYRIPTGNVHNVKGYGLGLSYVKKVVKTHRGSVSVKDNRPEGSIFTIRIPYEA